MNGGIGDVGEWRDGRKEEGRRKMRGMKEGGMDECSGER